MGFLDSSSVTTWPAWTTTATPVTATYGINVVSPHNGDRIASVSPTLTVAVDATPSPFKVQYQVATDTGFTTIVDDDTHTGVVSGTYASQTGTGLADGTTYYWRARVGDGTTWSAWTATVKLTIDLHTGNAYFYATENIGAMLTTVGDTAEEITLNVGCQLTLNPSAHDYLYENVGFERVLASLAADYAYVDVDDTAPHIPHIWFFYLPYGFVGSTVQIWGMGFGTVQTDYNGTVYLDPGPDHTTADIPLGITDWYVETASPHAYDTQRTIAASSIDGVLPVADPEHQVIEVVMPEAGMPPVDAGAQADPVYVVTTQGTSNKPTWLFYPTLPTSIATAVGELRTGSRVRIAPDPATTDALIEQRMAYLDPEPYLILGGRAERAPLLAALSVTKVTAGTATSTTGLTDPTTTGNLSATNRYLPTTATITTTTWSPTYGTDTITLDPLHEPLLDTTYAYAARTGDRTGTALTFNGDQWAQLTTTITGNQTLGTLTVPAGTIALVAVLHANPDGPRSTLLSTYQDTALTDPNHDFTLALTGDQLTLTCGGRIATDQITQVSGRPVIIILSWDQLSGDYLVLDTAMASHHFSWSQAGPGPTPKKLWLARPTTLATGIDETARMDLLDLATFNHRLTPADMSALANTYDGMYGASQ